VSSSGIMSIPNFVDFQRFKQMDTTDYYSSICGLFNDVVSSLDNFFRVLACYLDIRVEELWTSIRCRSYDVQLPCRYLKSGPREHQSKASPPQVPDSVL
jgi:hypothetical protein